MKTIYKYQVGARSNAPFQIPKGFKFLDVQIQGPNVVAWALVDTNCPLVEVTFRVYGTGHEVTSPDIYRDQFVGTFQTEGGLFVWHVFVGDVAPEIEVAL